MTKLCTAEKFVSPGIYVHETDHGDFYLEAFIFNKLSDEIATEIDRSIMRDFIDFENQIRESMKVPSNMINGYSMGAKTLDMSKPKGHDDPAEITNFPRKKTVLGADGVHADWYARVPIAEKSREEIVAQRKKDGVCPECGDRGEWISMALVCPVHGKFMG